MFLFGDMADTFAEITAPFVAAAGSADGDGSIALLMQGGREAKRYLPAYLAPLGGGGTTTVIPVYSPPDGASLTATARATIAAASGIFMAGGHVPSYHRAFVDAPVGETIRERVAAGVPFGGVSAGALLATATAVLTGDRAADEDGGHRLLAIEFDQTGGPLGFGDGLGLIVDALVEPHFTGFGGFPRLLAAMTATGTTSGLGIDEAAGVTIAGDELTVTGAGLVYLLRRTGPGSATVDMLTPGRVVPFP